MTHVFNAVAGERVNSSSDRRAIGLPEHYVPTRNEAPSEAIRRLVAVDANRLAQQVEDPSVPLEDRLAGGTVLAYFGDPRVRTLDPPMIEIEATSAMIGLDAERVETVAAELSETGVLPVWIAKECPAHPVLLAPYRIAKYPVTNQEFRDFLAETGHLELPTS